MAKLEMFATQRCWVCSACGQKYDALWRPTSKPFEPLQAHFWTADKPTFNYCPMCGEQLEHTDIGHLVKGGT